MSGHSIQVNFWPGWKAAVARYDLDQQKVNRAIECHHRAWLDGCGYDSIFDIDNCGFDADPNKPPGPNARPAYGVHDIRVHWGEWGTEHITVPGNACGLDLSRSIGGASGGMSLLPHNVDSMSQAYLLLLVFTWFADAIICNENLIEYHKRHDTPPSVPGERLVER